MMRPFGRARIGALFRAGDVGECDHGKSVYAMTALDEPPYHGERPHVDAEVVEVRSGTLYMRPAAVSSARRSSGSLIGHQTKS